ncbi:MAG: 50S ribosomal protein L4 [Dehalococcoidia bacterium]
MKLKVYDSSGQEVNEIEAADDVFGIEPNEVVVHQAYVAQMANRRAGGASTKRRGEVAGSTRKLRRQKGTGSARQGAIRSSSRVGGGQAMGPRPRSFARRMPRRMKRLAIRSALSGHAAGGSIVVVEGLVPGEARTSETETILDSVGAERRSLLVTGAAEPVLQRSARNIKRTKAMPAAVLNVVDLVNAHHILMTEEAVRAVEQLWGGDNIAPARGRKVEEA